MKNSLQTFLSAVSNALAPSALKVDIPPEWLQPVAVVNYPDEAVPYTRITEYKHLTGQVHPKTSLTYEFPQDEGEPYYPVPRPENAALLHQRYGLATEAVVSAIAGWLQVAQWVQEDIDAGGVIDLYPPAAATGFPLMPDRKSVV